MTPAKYSQEMTRLKGAVTRVKTACLHPMTLSDKIVAKQKVRIAENNLHNHKLNFYDLTKPSSEEL